MKIAIIGAGVSGLATAYYLKKYMPSADIRIYEKALTVGGNASTFEVTLNNGSKRWVDMAVNDFNKATYTELNQLWQELGIMDPQLQSTYCKPLINNASYSYPDGAYRYTIEIDGKVTVPADSSANATLITSENKRFKTELANWYRQPDADHNMPVGTWLAKYTFAQEFVYGNLYPRMNGMYFTMENSEAGTPPPSLMPMWMVAHYYILQEGYVQPVNSEEDLWSRQYFVNGSVQWLKFLEQNLISKGVKIGFNYSQLHVDRYHGKLTLYNGCVKVDDFDKVIFATHADDTHRMIDFKTREQDPMVDALKQFSYDSCDVFAHQDSSVLAPQGDCNRTYNIHIYDYNSVSLNSQIHKPYNITYVVNYHQNDPAAHINDPLFFISVNPFTRIDPSKILYQTNGQLAKSSFRHVKLDFNAMNAQILIDDLQLHQQGTRDYYFAGSFTRGAGLHVECVIQANEIATKIVNPAHISEQTYNFKDKKRHFAPRYLMNRIEPLLQKDAVEEV